jgi:hypothetical protein
METWESEGKPYRIMAKPPDIRRRKSDALQPEIRLEFQLKTWEAATLSISTTVLW